MIEFIKKYAIVFYCLATGVYIYDRETKEDEIEILDTKLTEMSITIAKQDSAVTDLLEERQLINVQLDTLLHHTDDCAKVMVKLHDIRYGETK